MVRDFVGIAITLAVTVGGAGALASWIASEHAKRRAEVAGKLSTDFSARRIAGRAISTLVWGASMSVTLILASDMLGITVDTPYDAVVLSWFAGFGPTGAYLAMDHFLSIRRAAEGLRDGNEA